VISARQWPGAAAFCVDQSRRMVDEKRIQWLARLVVWQGVAAFLVGWNVIPLSEPWTNWNLVSFACQAVLLVCAYRGIRRLEGSVARHLAHLYRRLER
jgi:hypothetical protein